MTSEKLPTHSMLDGGHQTVTLKDVAEASGVSISTVSRVLDERIPPSKSAAAQRVRAAADALGYRRNLSASVLRRGRTGTVGVLVPRLSDAVMALLYEALERAAQARGFFTIVATSGDDPDQELRATESLLDRNVDGRIPGVRHCYALGRSKSNRHDYVQRLRAKRCNLRRRGSLYFCGDSSERQWQLWLG